MKRKWIFAALVPMVLSLPRHGDAQFAGGPYIVISFPQQDFANVSGTGGGLGGKVYYNLPVAPFFSFRADLGYVSYGSDQHSASVAGYLVLVQTRNESFRFTVGSQVSFGRSRMKVYLSPMAGIYTYRSVVSIPDYAYFTGYPYAETTSSVTKLGWNMSGGFLLDIGLGPWIDVGVKYHTIDGAVKRKIGDTTVKSDAKDISLNVGVVFFQKK